MTISFGYKASAEEFGPRELLDFAVHAEKVGLDSVTVSDHFQPWRVTGGHSPNALTWLAAAAQRTDRVTLGTSVLTPTFRYNPAVIAQTFATLAELTPGRIFLGVGTGEALNELAVGSIDGEWPEFKERYARLREAVTLIRRLWTGERVDHDGEYYRTDGAMIFDRPEQNDGQVPIYVAAGGPMMARYAGRVGDGMICTSGKGAELYVDKLLPALAEGEEKADRSPGSVARMIEMKVSYHPDPATALENTRFWAPLALSAEEKHSIGDPAAMEAAADALPIEQIASRWIVASTPDEALAQIGTYLDYGFDHLVFHLAGTDQREQLDHFSRDVLPGLRDRVR